MLLQLKCYLAGYVLVIQLFCFIESDEQVMYFENFDLENVITPVNVSALEKLLIQTQYNPEKTEFLVDGFKEGFDLSYDGPNDVKITSPNLKIRGVGNNTILWNKVMKEVKLKRYAGPFTSIPYENFIQSPIGLVLKDNGKDVRLIFHLSYPRGTGKSVNSNTSKELSSVEYPDFSKAIRLCQEAGKECKLAHSDFTAAFRNLGIKKKSGNSSL